MKKNLRVNISGLIFNIDDDAYSALQKYLDRLRSHFGPGESTNEIISDIESGIAEMFQEKNGDSENIIDLNMVTEVIKAMGEPSEIDGEEENEKADSPKEKKTYEYTKERVKRRLYRDGDNKIIGGVSSGLATYFNIDPIWVRLGFVALTFSGMSILVYIILWIAIPEAVTTAQKLEMKGEAINLENIEKSIRDEFDDLSNRFKDIKDKHFTKKKDDLTIFEKLAHLIVRIVVGFFKFIASIIGIAFAFIALMLIIALIPSFFSNGMLWLNQLPGVHFISLPGTLDMLTNSSSDINLLLTALGMVVFVPLIALVYQGVKLIFGIRTKNSAIGISLFTIWIVGLVLLVYSSTQLGSSFNKKAEISHDLILEKFEGDTLYINFVNNDSLYSSLPVINSYNGQFLLCNDENYYFQNPKIRTKTVDADESFSIEVETMSRGRTHIKAKQNAKQINYSYNIKDSIVELSSYYYWPNSNQYRAQKVEITINIPEGKEVKFSPEKTYNEYYWNDKATDSNMIKCFENNNKHNFIYVDDYNDNLIIQSKYRRFEVIDGDLDWDDNRYNKDIEIEADDSNDSGNNEDNTDEDILEEIEEDNDNDSADVLIVRGVKMLSYELFI